MVSEMVLPSEPFAADVTWIRPLVCVCSLVDKQVVGLCKMATTKTTDELLLRPG